MNNQCKREQDQVNDAANRSVTVNLFVVVTDSWEQSAVWLPAHSVGHTEIADPAGRETVNSCRELRALLLSMGGWVGRILKPAVVPRYRLIAREVSEDAPLVGMGCWQTPGGSIYVSSGIPMTSCHMLGEPGHRCEWGSVAPHAA
ncbi:hypothetical protein [Streptomyces sp. NPDC053048]|uniref:hypothetical protein n=1 Tax=Streptomyces sp. NPDC053048 TaxID=3365694 RepID=UPI0037D49145